MNNWRHIFRLIPSTHRRKGMWVGLSLFFRALLNFAGVAALLPILNMILDDDGKREYLLPVCLAVLAFIVLKSLVNLLLIRFQNRYLLSLYRHFSYQLFRTYYRRGWLFIKKSGPSELSYEVNYACYAFSFNVLSPIFSMMAESILLILLYAAVLVYAPKEALLMLVVFLPAAWAYIRWGKNRLQYYGKQGNEAKRRQSRVVQELFKGYPEIEINQAFGNMSNRFEKGLRDISFFQERSTTIQSIPSSVMEICVVLGLIVMVLFGAGTDLKMTMGVFVVAALRMLPAIRSLLASWTAVKNNRFSVEVVEAASADFADSTPSTLASPISFHDSLRVEHLRFAYDTDHPVFRDLNFELHRGERLGIRGASGVGKSTLFHLLLGFFSPQEGRILIDGQPLNEKNRAAWQKKVGYVPQEVFIMNETLAENIAFGQDVQQIDKEKMRRVIEQVQLKNWVDSLPDGLNTRLGDAGNRMSGGQKQRVGIARALYKEAEILFFDEATSSLDRQTEQEISDAIQSLSETCREITMVIIAHRAESLSLCSRIVDME